MMSSISYPKKRNNNLDKDWILNTYDYEKDTGAFRWKYRTGHKAFNTRYAGTIAGHACPLGHWQIKHKGKNCPAHVVVALLNGFDLNSTVIVAKDGSFLNLNHNNLLFYDINEYYDQAYSNDYLESRFSYDEHTGDLSFIEQVGQECWNSRYANTPIKAVGKRGYLVTNFMGFTVYVHRVIAVLAGLIDHYKSELNIDHINGDRLDNRLCNLRAIPAPLNNKNSKRPVTNTSGVIGVYKVKSGKYAASIQSENIIYMLGTFDTLEEAAIARKEAEVKHGFHENHGRVMEDE